MATRPRLSRSRPAERRALIVTIAESAFVGEGYSATSMAAIAARLGGSKALLYKYFSSKERLLEAVIERYCLGVPTPLHDLCNDQEFDLEPLLTIFGDRFLTKIYEGRALDVYRLIHSEGGRFPELVRFFYRCGPDAVLEELRTIIEIASRRGQIGCVDSKLAAEQFLGMLRGERFWRSTMGVLPAPAHAEILRHARQAAAVFVRGQRQIDLSTRERQPYI